MIHPLAYVHPDARVAAHVSVEPFAYIAADVTVDEGTWIGPHAILDNGARIGRACKIFGGAVIAGVPQDLKYRGEKTTAEIGDGTMVREYATVNRGTAARNRTVVGRDALVMSYAHVGHDCVVGDHCILANNVSLAGEVEVDHWAILGGHVAVHQFTRVGKHVMVSGGTMVSMDIPPYILVGHSPATYGGINSVGLKRRGFSPEQLTLIQDMCRILFQSGYAYSKGVERVKEQIPDSPERGEMLDFIAASTRGLVKPYQSGR